STTHIDVRAPNFDILGGASPAPSDTWQYVNFSFNSGGNQSILLYAGYFGESTGSWLDVDDLSIFETDPPPLPAGAFQKDANYQGQYSCDVECANGTGVDTGPVGYCVGGYVDSGLG